MIRSATKKDIEEVKQMIYDLEEKLRETRVRLERLIVKHNFEIEKG